MCLGGGGVEVRERGAFKDNEIFIVKIKIVDQLTFHQLTFHQLTFHQLTFHQLTVHSPVNTLIQLFLM